MFENIQNKYIIALIDPEYFYDTFTEDAHPRSRLTNKLYKQEKDKEVNILDVGPKATYKDVKDILFKNGNKIQNRTLIRNDKKLNKETTFKIRDERNRQLRTNHSIDAKEKDKEIMLKRQKAANIKNNTPLSYSSSSAYMPSHKTIIKTSDNPRALEHEKRHHKDDMYLRSNYDKSVSNRLFKINAKDNETGKEGMYNASKAKTPDQMEKAGKKINTYLSNPLEHNGLKAGAEMKNKNDTDVNKRIDPYARKVIDNYVKKGIRPKGSIDDFKKNHHSF